MDEQVWLECSDPDELVAFLQDRERVSDRKARLFAVACCRRIWALLVEQCAELGAVYWKWQSADGAMGKARFGGKKGGQESHRSRQKRHQTQCVGR